MLREGTNPASQLNRGSPGGLASGWTAALRDTRYSWMLSPRGYSLETKWHGRKRLVLTHAREAFGLSDI
jgi:hypothetical protein